MMRSFVCVVLVIDEEYVLSQTSEDVRKRWLMRSVRILVPLRNLYNLCYVRMACD